MAIANIGKSSYDSSYTRLVFQFLFGPDPLHCNERPGVGTARRATGKPTSPRRACIWNPYTWCKSVICTGIYWHVLGRLVRCYSTSWYVLLLKSTYSSGTTVTYQYVLFSYVLFRESTYQYITVCSTIGTSRYIPGHTGTYRYMAIQLRLVHSVVRSSTYRCIPVKRGST